MLAHIANEQVLRDIFLRGEDVHTETASAVFELPPDQLDVGMRSKAKMVNYGIVYGLSRLRPRGPPADLRRRRRRSSSTATSSASLPSRSS